jgi:dTDP-4-dehydrorhamnose 3,5-epimerase-like enzyme
MQPNWRSVDAQTFLDNRGALKVLDGPVLPFLPQRVFWVTGVSKNETRGFHAHRTGHQLMFCIQGGVSVRLFDGLIDQKVAISPNSPGIHVMPGVWGEQTYLEDDSILLVLSSIAFSEDDYIRSKEEFELFIQQAK